MMKLGWMTRPVEKAKFEEHVQFARSLDLDVIDIHMLTPPPFLARR